MPDQQPEQESMQKKRPEPPKGPPCRTFKDFAFLGSCETKESIRDGEDYKIYIKAYMEGFAAGKYKP
jgi:hypothetical protein